MQSNLNIFLISDNNYVPYLATTIASICYNTKAFCNFYVLNGGISEENQNNVCELKKQFNNFSIDFIKVNTDKFFKNFQLPPRIPYSTYSRFLVQVLKPELDKALCLDTDIVLLGDIAELYNINMENFAIAAMPELFAENGVNEERKHRLGLASNHKYFNCGILMMDIKKWTEQDIVKKLFDIAIKCKDKIKTCDQDVINMYFDNNNYYPLEQRYNYLTQNFSFFKAHNYILRHYNGVIKPWHIHPDIKEDTRLEFMNDKDNFWKYAKMTPFYDKLVADTKYKTDTDLRKFLVYKLMQERKNGTAK